MIQGLDFHYEAVDTRGIRNEPSEVVAVGIMRGLCRLLKLSGKKPSVPMRVQQFMLEVQRYGKRDFRSPMKGLNAIEEPYRKGRTVQTPPAVEIRGPTTPW
jgi:hypothetical protein